MSEVLLETRGLSRTFGGLDAVIDVALKVNEGEIRAVIGPNGAGKTTLVSMICGRLAPSAGCILFRGTDITRTPAWKRVAMGIVYTFQVTSIYGALSVHENVALAARSKLIKGTGLLGGTREKDVGERVVKALSALGLEEDIDRRADELPYGHQRLLEVAMALALEPRLLILDEPTQGLSEHDIANFCTHIGEIANRTTVLLIEHNMEVVLNMSSHITVLDQGRVIADGNPASIEADPLVQDAYLGGL